MQPRGKWFPTVAISLAIALGGCKEDRGGAESDAKHSEPRILITQSSGLAAGIPATPLIRKPLPVAEHTRRAHDYRVFQAELPIVPPAALQDAEIYLGKYDALQGDALYVLEVPDGWDGDGLIMWARGYAGDGDILTLPTPPAAWRQAVIGAGYAWAASSYSANFYDARAGLEDTNKLALNVMSYVERDSGARLSVPNQYLISGAGMGGHVAAAAVDRENNERTNSKVPYEGAAPFCQSEQNQFQWLGDYTWLMMELAGYGDEDYSKFPELVGQFQYVDTLPSLVRFGPMVDALFFRQPPGEPKWL
ncbi:hypothetical protein [Halopseudomonas xinjiangensis]|uniref:hypothetical protein n=1 Tax=Halopseudomonas xinjiangensis TaxID=487184 RepID=UPI000B80DD18|nr:hypothetical protein [Halopseudomonas xinjiangensis]